MKIFIIVVLWFLSGLFGLIELNLYNGKTPFFWSKCDPALDMPPTFFVFIIGPVVFSVVSLALICIGIIKFIHIFIDLLDKPFKNRAERIQTERVRSWDITELRPTPMPRPAPPPRPKPIAVSKPKQKEVFEITPTRKLVLED